MLNKMLSNSKPDRLSPLQDWHQKTGARFANRAGWLVPEVYTTPEEESAVLHERAGLIDISARGKLMIKGKNANMVVAAAFGSAPIKPGNVIGVKSNHLSASLLVSDELLVLTSPGAEDRITASLTIEIESQGSFVSVFNWTSGLAGLLICGPQSTAVMEKLSAIPFNPKDFPNLFAAQCGFAKVRAAIIRQDRMGLPAYELYVDRSYGTYLWNTILDAGREFGMQPAGWESLKY